MGRDEPERQRAESQWIVAARPLCHLQYPIAYLSRLQRILPAARWKLYFNCTLRRPSRPFHRGGLANDMCPWGPRPLLRVGKWTTSTCVACSPDSDLEAFSHNPAYAHVPYWWVNNPTLGEFCFTMIGRADIEGSKSNVAMNAWLPQASYPCGNFSDTSSFEFRRSKGSLGHAFTMCRPSQTPHLTMSSARIGPQSEPWVQKEGQCPASDSRNNRIPLVRTSSELAVRRAGKAPEGTVPSPSPGRHAATRSRRGSSSSSPPTADGFGTGTPVPSPQSQSFSRSYGSILPTSLAYIVPSTRGCSPWRPDAVMSTTGRGRHSVLRIFKGRRERTGHHATCGALPAAGPYLRLSRFQALDGIHRQIWAAFPNNPTRRQRLVVRQGPGTTGLSPSPAPPSRGLGPGPPPMTALQTTIRTTEPPDSNSGLFPRVVPPDLGSRSERLSAKGSWSPNARRAVAAATKRVELQPPLAATSVDVDSHLGQPRARGLREASIRPATTARPAVGARCEGGDAMRDAQADVPSA
ncbi:hypothetical protein CQW23_34040 [Capsicum baccatum]|uniref:Protein TAR1 n=1 Tax=Capsicum baccatum TaxID=33114 RepID=A0A2G2V003_CAPBA|nr:hypothetical protein CQW23_34040 [Capsicum baccatum]